MPAPKPLAVGDVMAAAGSMFQRLVCARLLCMAGSRACARMLPPLVGVARSGSSRGKQEGGRTPASPGHVLCCTSVAQWRRCVLWPCFEHTKHPCESQQGTYSFCWLCRGFKLCERVLQSSH
jgi:hypothetical protein